MDVNRSGMFILKNLEKFILHLDFFRLHLDFFRMLLYNKQVGGIAQLVRAHASHA